ncbi:wnt inhibitory factor 1-like [Mya arenaria]|uniref:wnt inhibitory factor 1-like n=1 Tax=Mya arenaria TaxID=6604 RepID=UPI0022E0CD64|nr:wnt inhibitory factor 1-like [Mya arenaria]
MNGLLFGFSLIVVAFAQQHHPPHHPHPGGPVACHQDTDCAGCDAGLVGFCETGVCYCRNESTVVVKRAACTDNADCPACQNGLAGTCNAQGHCECQDTAHHPVGKRAACTDNADCPACQNGLAGTCNAQGHCECQDTAHHPGLC